MIIAALNLWLVMFPDWGREISSSQTKVYIRALGDIPEELLAEALKRATQHCTRFPVPGDVMAHVETIRSERRSDTPRRNANCPDCDGTGWRYVGRGVRPCKCRPAPPPEELRSPPTPVEGLEREIALIAEKVKI